MGIKHHSLRRRTFSFTSMRTIQAKEGVKMAVMEYIDAIRLAMKEEMERDEDVFVLGEDVGLKGGVFTTTKGLQEQFGEMRVMDTPLAESAIAGVAIGAAMYGMKPIAEMQYSD